MRIRVELDILKPLKDKMKLKYPRGEWVWVKFQYEYLSTFYFYCGFLGHFDKFCAKGFNNPKLKEEMPYGM